MGQSKFDKKMEVRRTRNKLAGNVGKLESAQKEYVEKAKAAYKRGDKHAYSLARSGLATTITQLHRTREMLLNIDITTQMRDTGEITEEFLTGMETIFRRLGKINKSVDIKKAQSGLRSAIAGMENVQAQLDTMLMESEDTFAEISGAGAYVSEGEIDRLLGINAATEEETEIGSQLDKLMQDVEREKEEARQEPPMVYKVTPAGTAPEQTAAPQKAAEPATTAADPNMRWHLNEQYNYDFPPLDLLDDYAASAVVREENERALMADAEEAEKVLAELGVPAKVINRVVGPAFSRLEMAMPVGMSVQKIEPLLDDIAMRLGKPARFEVPIVGKNAFGIEIANARRETVGLKELVGSSAFADAGGGAAYCLAVDSERNCVVKDLTRAPHMIIAGSTGSGKSCFLHAMITSLMYKYSPSRLRFAIIDFKRVEMAVYNGTPYLLTDKVVDTDEDALEMLNMLSDEMERRYDVLVHSGCRNIDEYNDKVGAGGKMPYIAVFVDEYADISTSPLGKEFANVIRRLSQKARASGIHLVLATQRPSTDVISGTIKNNFPVQIAFKVARKEDSRTTLAGQSGAELLLGNGDMLYNEPSGGGLKRLQAPYVSGKELKRVCDWVVTHARKG